MSRVFQTQNLLASLQWFFFIFANIVIIPITVGEAFELNQAEVVSLVQMSFIVTGLACLAQAFFGHRRPILEGQSGLWWGIYLTLVATSSAQGISLVTLGGSLVTGIVIAGIITILIGVLGIGPIFDKLFTPGVMGVFMFLLGLTLIEIFLKGMLQLPFGNADESQVVINLPVAALSIFIALVVIIISIKSPPKIRSYALLIGIVLGWGLYVLLFPSEESVTQSSDQVVSKIFPLGEPVWNTGIIVTVVLASLLNISNTFGALKGTDVLLHKKTTKRDYATSFSITGIATIAAGIFGLVPYAPYVSSIGFLKQTNIYERLPFIVGSFLFFLMGVIPPIGEFFSLLPLSVGSAVLFVAYLQLFNSSIDFFKQITFNTLNVYRSALPLFVGIIIMTFPASYFESFPSVIRPFISNGLLVGIILALILENVINWDRFASSFEKNKN